MTTNKNNKVDEIIDDASLIMGATKIGTIVSSKIAKDNLKETKRFRIADKIGRLLKELES